MATRDRAEDLAIAAAIGQRVRERRQAAGLTQERLAELAELHPTFVSNLERGYRVPSVVTVLRIAHGLGIQPGQLVDELRP